MGRLERSLESTPVIEKEGYHYFVHPVSDGVPMLEPDLLREIVVRIIRASEIESADKIVTPAAMGIHISTAVSLMTDVPVVVVRKRQYGLDGEVSLRQVTGYSETDMYVNDVHAGDRVVVIDDVISTGGTLSAMVGALEEIGAEIVDLVAVIEKQGGEDRMADSAYDVTSLVSVEMDGDTVRIVD